MNRHLSIRFDEVPLIAATVKLIVLLPSSSSFSSCFQGRLPHYDWKYNRVDVLPDGCPRPLRLALMTSTMHESWWPRRGVSELSFGGNCLITFLLYLPRKVFIRFILLRVIL